MEENTKVTVIKAKAKGLNLNLKEVWLYRDLIKMFVKRNFTTTYKQTILGPLWFIITPLLSTFVFTLIFGNIAGLSTEGVPAFLFYLASNTIWSYFSTCLTKTSSTFTSNSSLFGKVYFPRLVMPISIVIYSLLSFVIQFVIMLGVGVYYYFSGEISMVNLNVLLTPVLLLETMCLALGFGIIISSLTTKYKDLSVLVSFGVTLWMYATPVVYSVNSLPENLRKIIMLNPMSPIVESFRCIFTGSGSVPTEYLVLSGIVTIVVLFIGVLLFNKVERTFMDTV